MFFHCGQTHAGTLRDLLVAMALTNKPRQFLLPTGQARQVWQTSFPASAAFRFSRPQKPATGALALVWWIGA